ncbi:MAG: diacylglycerol kinase family lipid kinase [Firmicutes bacterium]|nr:diacylglycerol kinase family lipid kinase [Bacillota bacterium]
MKQKYYFIINPTANNGRVMDIWRQVVSELARRNVNYDYAVSPSEEKVVELAEAAAGKGCIVVGVGGDGTISRIAGALAGNKAIMGLIPAGTGNDFARTFAIPADPKAAVEVLLQGKTTAIDLGCINGRCFCNVIGAGLDAQVVADANGIFKKFAGSLAYLLALVRQLFLYRPWRVKITMNEQIIYADAWLIAVANACYYGGGMMVAPQADPRDGYLDVVLVQNVSLFKFLRLFPLVYRGRHINLDVVRKWRTMQLTVESEEPLAIQVDGDVFGVTPFDLKVLPQAVNFIVP